ncbi:hypothetical protein GE21DRAFT_1311212 [Neurospora crassa]|nr:hypothetical protein GE21DRAFT_1311212 [Neurospora crassa]
MNYFKGYPDDENSNYKYRRGLRLERGNKYNYKSKDRKKKKGEAKRERKIENGKAYNLSYNKENGGSN